jgi:secondary thiamine-phosphate synthase enzyme
MIRLTIRSSARNQMLDITSQVAQHLPREFSGVAVVFVPHTTAAVTINEGADPAVKNDLLRYLEKLVPHSGSYTHNEGNSDAHIKSALIGNSANIIIDKGRMALGTWQAVYFCEFDGPRERNIFLELLKNE